MGTHSNLLLEVDDAEQLTRFMHLVGSKLGKEIARHTGWKEKIWGRRFQAIVITDEEAAQLDRLRYVLEQGTKEGLVASPLDWPGVHCAAALISGEALHGYWYDRTKEGAARRHEPDRSPLRA